MKSTMTTLRVAILGKDKVGKSAVTVRFLTKRFIGEYNSNIDLLYRSSVKQDESIADVEVLDCCTKKGTSLQMAEAQLSWADGLVVVYSICDRPSLHTARSLLEAVAKVRSPGYVPVLLLGNKTDLEHHRTVGVEEGHELALEYGCQYYEVSAAEGFTGINIAFRALLREARIVQQQRSVLIKRRRSSLVNVSRKLGAMFGKASKSDSDPERRRPSCDVVDKRLL